MKTGKFEGGARTLFTAGTSSLGVGHAPGGSRLAGAFDCRILRRPFHRAAAIAGLESRCCGETSKSDRDLLATNWQHGGGLG